MEQATAEAARQALERSEFWWMWWVTAAAAFATVCAALVALFGEKWRAHWFRPDLRLSLANPLGELIRSSLTDPMTGAVRDVMARYYHVHVSNAAPWPRATQVQVWLTRVEERGPDNELKTTWASEVPIRWQHQEIRPLAISLNAGGTRADLCSLHKDKGLRLHPLIEPNNLQVWRTRPFSIVLSIQARAAEGVSPLRRFQVSWDGEWVEGEREMGNHLVLRDLGSAAIA